MIHVVYSWRCVVCPATGEGEDSAKAAEKHAKKEGHAAIVTGVPE